MTRRTAGISLLPDPLEILKISKLSFLHHCRSHPHQALSNEFSVVEIGVDTVKNEFAKGKLLYRGMIMLV